MVQFGWVVVELWLEAVGIVVPDSVEPLRCSVDSFGRGPWVLRMLRDQLGRWEHSAMPNVYFSGSMESAYAYLLLDLAFFSHFPPRSARYLADCIF